MKVETWLNHDIRFVQVEGEWWAVAKDVAVALDYSQTQAMTKLLREKHYRTFKMDDRFRKEIGEDFKYQSGVILLGEFGIYKAVLNSHKSEAEAFEDWVFNLLKQLRQESDVESYQVFRMMDNEHQKSIMENLHVGLPKPEKRHYIKANTIANKAVSTKHGYSKMVKKDHMTDDMIADRQPILNDTVELMVAKDHFKLDLSVSEVIYDKHTH